MLQGHCFDFDHRHDLFRVEIHHAKFQVNPLRNGWDKGCLAFRGSAALHVILQSCRMTILTLDPFHLKCHHTKLAEILSIQTCAPAVVGVVVVV